MTALPADRCDAPEQPQLDDTQTPPTFASLGVPAPLVEVLDEQGITAPFPVQAATLPDGLAGRDILGRAQTGSGKTLGFSLPMVARLAGRPTAGRRPRGLVLVPTRELATQVTLVLKPLGRAMDLWVTTIYGGVTYGPQVSNLRRGSDIIVATPGRLADLIAQGECDLSDVEITVIDEADQMADLGFLPIVRRLLESTPDTGQRMLFSATLDAAIDVLARRFLNHPVQHMVDENSSPAEIVHHVLTIEPGNRLAVLVALVGGEKRSLVFTRTKHTAERLARQLTEAGIPAAELHGNLRQGARSRNLAAFGSGVAQVMVATDIAARGIHIDAIDLVVHSDPPADHKAYVHRSGRTARGGADGVVVTLQTRSQAGDVTTMIRKGGITPLQTIAVDGQSEALTEIGGPPAPRVEVSGKVAELVRPEDRFTSNDRPGVGKPWEGRPRGDRSRDRDRDRKPRDDRFRDRPERPARRHDAGPGPRPRPVSDAPRRFDRDDRGERFPRAERSERPDRDARYSRDDRGDRFQPSDRERSQPSGRYGRSDGGQSADRGYRGDRSEGPARFERRDQGDGYQRPQGQQDRRFERPERGQGFQRPGDGDRYGRGSARPAAGGAPGRRDHGNSNDWWPRTGGGSSSDRFRQGGPQRPSSAGSTAGRDGWQRDDRGRDGAGRDDRSRDDRSRDGTRGGSGYREGGGYQGDRSSSGGDRGGYRGSRPAAGGARPYRDDRPYRAERPARPQAGGHPGSEGHAGRPSRPQAGPRAGGSPRRFGNSAGRSGRG